MASDRSAVVGSISSAQVVGNAFVHQFYKILHQSPQIAYRFYQENSKLGRPGLDDVMESIATEQAINEKILEMDWCEIKAEIKSVDAQESLNGGVIVLVTGSHEGKDLVRKDFAQCFFLATQVKGFFVLNDLFRYVDEDDNELATGTVAPLSFEQDRSRGFPSFQSQNAKRISKKGRTRHGSNSTRAFTQASSIASNQSTIVGSPPPAHVVGNAFAQQFYHILLQSPQHVYRFYHESSKLGRSGPNGVMESVTNMQAINKKILEMDFGEHTAEIQTVDAQESLDGGVTVLVTGHLTGKDLVKKCFAQSFFLAPQDKGFFVLNDIFRNMGKNSSNPSPHLGEATAHNQVHRNSYAEALLAPPSSSITEESQLAMAISASIQSAMAEGVLIDPNELDINSKAKTNDSRYGSSSKTKTNHSKYGSNSKTKTNDSKYGSSSNTTTTNSCVICLDAQVEGACIPCGHMAGCMHCLNVIKSKKGVCPVCRATIDQVVKIYCV